MNSTNITTGAYIGSEMHTTNLQPHRETIINDFGSDHVLKHRNLFANAVTENYESAGSWYDNTIELMSESMVYGANHFKNFLNTGNWSFNYQIDNSQLSLFRLDHTYIIARPDRNSSTSRYWWWLRDVVSSTDFANVSGYGNCNSSHASVVCGVRPAFLIY